MCLGLLALVGSDCFGDGRSLAQGTPEQHESGQTYTFWTNDNIDNNDEIWEVDGNFRAFMTYMFNGKYGVAVNTLKDALEDYYIKGPFNHSADTRQKAAKIIQQL